MARATMIYLIVEINEGDRPTAAFTVKYEAQRWLDNFENPEEFKVLSMRDGLRREDEEKLPCKVQSGNLFLKGYST